MTLQERIIDLENKIKLYPTMSQHELIKLRDDDLKILRESSYSGNTADNISSKVYVDLLNKFYKGRQERQDELSEISRSQFLTPERDLLGIRFPKQPNL